MWLIIWCPLSPNYSHWIFLNHVKTAVQSSAQTFWVKCKSFAFKCNKCTQLEVLACTEPVNTLFQILLCMWHILGGVGSGGGCGGLGCLMLRFFSSPIPHTIHTIRLQPYTVGRMYYLKYWTFLFFFWNCCTGWGSTLRLRFMPAGHRVKLSVNVSGVGVQLAGPLTMRETPPPTPLLTVQ